MLTRGGGSSGLGNKSNLEFQGFASMKCTLKSFLFSQAKKTSQIFFFCLGVETLQKPKGCSQILHLSYNVQCLCVYTDLPSIYGSLGKMIRVAADNLEASRSCLVLVAGASVGTYRRQKDVMMTIQVLPVPTGGERDRCTSK